MMHNAFESLLALYNLMDHSWDTIAAGYDFQCNGCKDNCCNALFFHHTHIEQAYFIHGFHLLDQDKKEMVLDRAKNYCQKTFIPDAEIKSLKIMCPANEKNRCLLYPYRPMICRLHGLPHELVKPGSNPVRGLGCHAGLFDSKPYIKFDRTPFYKHMAQIEMAFRQDTNKSGKIKQTVAQMLVSQ